MKKQISATLAKNNFGGLLHDVATLGRVDIVRHGRVVAVVLSPQALQALVGGTPRGEPGERTHMIPAHLARAAQRLTAASDFDDD